MARKVELRSVSLNGADTANFNYGHVMGMILKSAPPDKGLLLDQIIEAVNAMQPLEQAVRDGADHVVFSEDQWRTLRNKLDQFPFAVADPVIVEFGLAIRNAKEIT